MKPDEGKAATLLGSVVSRNVYVPHFTVLAKHVLEIFYTSPVRQIVHFKRDLREGFQEGGWRQGCKQGAHGTVEGWWEGLLNGGVFQQVVKCLI